MVESTITVRLQAVDNASRTVNKFAKTLKTRLKAGVDAYKESVDKAEESMGRFRAELLSMLFFGMAIQRVFKGMLVQTTKFFQEVTEGQTQAGMALSRLNASFQFLKFTIGDAIASTLLPMIPTITDFIDKIADWTDRNPKLASSIVLIGLAIGTLLMGIGVLGLGLQGITQFMKVSVIPAFSFFGSIVGISGGALLSIVGIVGLLIAISKNARNAIVVFGKSVWGVIKNLVLLIKDIFVGNMENVGDRVLIILFQLAKAFVALGRTVFSVVTFIASAIVGLALTPLYLLARLIDTILNKLGRSSNIAGQVASQILKITDAIENFNQGNLLQTDTFFTTQAEAAQGRIDSRTASQGGGVSIDTVNITTDSPGDFEDWLDEVNRQQSTLRGGNI